MSYDKNTWASGDVITAAKLNSMESGIEEMSAEYVKQTWANGDVITAAKLNHMEDGIASGGGGGESDFSTATLHIVNSTGSSVRAYCPIVFDNDGTTYAQTRLRTSEEEQDFTVILYGTNGAYLSFQDEGSFKYTISGDIESADQEYPDYWVTGDCTVTVTQVT